MTMPYQYFQLFAVQPDASAREIKAAFRRLIMQYHPDRNQQDPKAAERFHLIQGIFQQLISQQFHPLSSSDQQLLNEILKGSNIVPFEHRSRPFRYHADTIKRHYQKQDNDKGVKVAIAV